MESIALVQWDVFDDSVNLVKRPCVGLESLLCIMPILYLVKIRHIQM